MRCVPILILLAQMVVAGSATRQPPRLDVNGDPLPDGALARLGTLRFQLPDAESASSFRFRGFDHGPAIALAPDGKSVAFAIQNKDGGRIRFLDTATGKTLRDLDLGEAQAQRLLFTPDGKNLVINGWSGIQWIDAATGKVAWSITIDQARECPLALSADGNLVAVQPQKYVYDAPVRVWDAKTGKETVELPGRGALCKGLAFSSDGKRLLLWSIVPTQVTAGSMSYGSESKVALACIDVNQRKIVGETTVGSAQNVALCADGETVALQAADNQSVRVRHLPTGAERCAIAVKASLFAFTPDGRSLLTIDTTGQGALWNAATGAKLRDLEGALANTDIVIVGMANDGATIAALDGGWDSAASVVVWNAATGKRMARPPGHEAAVTCIAYSASGTMLVSGSLDKTVRLWNPSTGEQLRMLTVHTDAITAVTLSPDGKRAASSSKSGAIRVSNLTDGKTVADFTGPANGATALAFSPDGTVLFAGGNSPELLAWEIATTKEVVRLKTGDDGAVMAFGAGGALALTANGEIRAEGTPERLQVWQPLTKLPAVAMTIRKAKDGDIRCDAAIFSADGRWVASSQVSEYQDIRPSYGATRLSLWERISGQPIRTLAPSITKVVAFSPDGRLLAAGGAGQSGHLSVGYGAGIDIWDTLTGQKAGTLPVTPECAAFSPDGAQVATGCRDNSVLIWPAPKVQLPKPAPTAAEREAWWTVLGGEAKEAYPAMAQMLADPEHAVAVLKKHIRPIQSGNPDVVAKLIAQLDSNQFAERAAAQEELEMMGEAAAHLISKALAGNVSLEMRRRLEELLRRSAAASPAALQQHRAVATLEWIGQPAARALLRTLADGAPQARLTLEARAALKRLQGE